MCADIHMEGNNLHGIKWEPAAPEKLVFGVHGTCLQFCPAWPQFWSYVSPVPEESPISLVESPAIERWWIQSFFFLEINKIPMLSLPIESGMVCGFPFQWNIACTSFQFHLELFFFFVVFWDPQSWTSGSPWHELGNIYTVCSFLHKTEVCVWEVILLLCA